jgi:hypothetical protein
MYGQVCVLVCVYVCMGRCVHVRVRAFVVVYAGVPSQTDTHTHTHTNRHTHTYTHTHTHTLPAFQTEIARRLAKLVNAPFIKVEATKYTEIGFHGTKLTDSIFLLFSVFCDEKPDSFFANDHRHLQGRTWTPSSGTSWSRRSHSPRQSGDCVCRRPLTATYLHATTTIATLFEDYARSILSIT